MNLRLTLIASGGIVATGLGGYHLIGKGNNIPAGDKAIQATPEGDQLLPPRTPPKTIRVALKVPRDDKGKWEAYNGNLNHFIGGSRLFLESNNFKIPRYEGRLEEIREWESKKPEIRKRIKDEFGEEIEDGGLYYENIETMLRHAILRLCQGEDEGKRGSREKYCMIEEEVND